MGTLTRPFVTVIVFLIRDGKIFLQKLKDGSLGGFEFEIESDTPEIKSGTCERLNIETPVRVLPRHLNNRALVDGSGNNPKSTWVYSVRVFHLDEELGTLSPYDRDSVPYDKMNPFHKSFLQSAPFFTEDEGYPIRITVD